jgi:predicted NUDIX family NTP pyrophosphohydrolase
MPLCHGGTVMSVFAVFAVARIHGLICATTRPDGSIGLPGGKVDEGESPERAACREAREEGWNLCIGKEIHRDTVDGKLIVWFAAKVRRVPVVENHKEQYRGIHPIAVPASLLTSGFGNEFLK